jgi:hypothetical protein
VQAGIEGLHGGTLLGARGNGFVMFYSFSHMLLPTAIMYDLYGKLVDLSQEKGYNCSVGYLTNRHNRQCFPGLNDPYALSKPQVRFPSLLQSPGYTPLFVQSHNQRPLHPSTCLRSI